MLTIVAVFMLSGCGTFNFSGSASGSIKGKDGKGAFNSSAEIVPVTENASIFHSASQQQVLAEDA